MNYLRALFLSTAVITAIVATGCGDDEDNKANTEPDGGDQPIPTDDGGNPNIDGGNPDGPNADTFPAYVKSLIDTKTTENGLPEAESVWGALPDDETAATAAALFPPAYFQ
jgi:hypothetical protein